MLYWLLEIGRGGVHGTLWGGVRVVVMGVRGVSQRVRRHLTILSLEVLAATPARSLALHLISL